METETQKETNFPVTKIVSKTKSQATIKIFGSDTSFIDQILAGLPFLLKCERKSALMYNHGLKQFYVYVDVSTTSPKERT